MHVLVFDPFHAGHHLNWVRLLIEACVPYADRITFATTSESAQSAEYAQHLSRISDRFDLDDSILPPTRPTELHFEGFRVARRMWEGLALCVRKNQPDHVFIAFVDPLTRAPYLNLMRKRPLGVPAEAVEALLFELPVAFGPQLPWRIRLRTYLELYGASKLPVGRMLVLAPLALPWLERHFPSFGLRCTPIPDAVTPVVTYDKSVARRQLGVPEDGRLISCIGVLDVRKGVDEFVRSFAAAPLQPTDRLLLAGRASAVVLEAIAAARAAIGADRLIVYNHMISDQELDWALSASDIVSIAYRFPNHIGMTSLLVRAVAADRPILAMEQGWPGYITRELSLGWIFPSDTTKRPAAIRTALDESADYVPRPEARAFADANSRERWSNILVSRLRARVEGMRAVAQVAT